MRGRDGTGGGHRAHSSAARRSSCSRRSPASTWRAVYTWIVFAVALRAAAGAGSRWIGVHSRASGCWPSSSLYPYYADNLPQLPIFGAVPGVDTGVVMLDLRDDGARPERRRRLRRAARPRLCRLLRDRRLHGRAGSRPRSSPDALQRELRTSAAIGVGRALGGIHITIWLLLLVAGVLAALIGADRPADAAAARRLPRDRDPRLRRDPAAGRAQRRQPVRPEHHERPAGDRAARPARVRQHVAPLGAGQSGHSAAW